ncbi:germination protein YpeB [Desmospora profundinema]|uniref:Spore germination protein n=1 Tax=Desmospora profundinema TaxID=1571184 RepID=A0ABU1IIZ9_9BACL|nr:germination protein YpeB [Desmospora profundinema]MDR6224527.1 spore germination protein [Desmospora profundinema]
MYRRIAAILFPVALVFVIGLGFWGYQENQDKNSLLIKTENQYQRAFHDLNYHMDKLQDELGKALALNTRRQLSTCMTNVWRLSYSAQNDLAQLPLTLMPFEKTESFLARIGDYTYRVGVRDLDQEPLTDREYQNLRKLYKRANTIQRDLQKVQNQVLTRQLRWMDVEMALASEDKQMDNSIIDGFKEVDKLAEGYEELDWGPTINNMEATRRVKHNQLKGKMASPEDAKEKVADVLDLPDTNGMDVVKNQKGNYETYSVRYQPNRGEDYYFDLTSKGNYVVWMMHDRTVNERKVKLEEAQAKAIQFLDELGYPEMEATAYDDVGNTAAFTFVRKQDGALIYPETVVVKVALDNAEVMGYQAENYVFNFKEERDTEPSITEGEARKNVNPRLKLKDSGLAVIFNDEGQETLCYEFQGNLGKSPYRVFINAKNGDEEKVEKIKEADQNRL